jgi:hypothetical protein
MKFADRLKVNASGVSSQTLAAGAVITMGAAVNSNRTLAQAIADGAAFSHTIKVGDTNVGFVVDDGVGNWLNGLFTLTSTTQITLTQILTSSAGGGPVTLQTSTPTVYNADAAFALNSGLSNPHDPGFDIIICAGQSNMVGQDTPVAALDIADPRVFSFGCYLNETATYQQLTQAVNPLRFNYNPSGYPTLPSVGNGAGLSPAEWFAKTYAGMIPSNRKVLLVPVARAATYLVAQTAEWNPGDTTSGGVLYENAITQANLAVTAAQALYPKSRVVGVIWLQGESDASWSISQINYAAALKTLLQGFRNRINTASNSWTVIMGMIGEYVGRTDPQSNAYYPIIDAAHQQVAAEFPRCAYTPGLTGYHMGVTGQSSATVHYNATGARILGCNAAGVVPQAMLSKGVDTTAPIILRATVTSTATSTVAVTLSEPFDPNYPPQLAAWSVTGHTVTAVSGVGNVVYLTVSTPFVGGEAQRTVTFTAQGNGIRDLAGNMMATQSPVNITNNAPANATAVTLTGATSGQAGQPVTLSIGVSPVGGNINGTLQVTLSDGGTGSTLSATTVNLTNASPTASVTFTPAAAGTYTISATNNGSLTNPANITFTASAAATVTSVSITPSTANMVGGTSQQFNATVNGTNSPPQTVTWSVQSGGGSITTGGLYTAGNAAGTAVIQATSTYDTSKSSTATITITANSNTDLKLVNLQQMTDISVGGAGVAPYSYQTNSGVTYNASPNGGVTQLALAGDGQVVVKLNNVSAGQHMISFTSTSTNVPYNNGNVLCTLMAKTSGYATWNGTVASTTTTGRIPANNDYVKAVRSGTQIIFSVSTDNTNWTEILRYTVAAGTVYCQMQSAGTGQFINPVGSGFA